MVHYWLDKECVAHGRPPCATWESHVVDMLRNSRQFTSLQSHTSQDGPGVIGNGKPPGGQPRAVAVASAQSLQRVVRDSQHAFFATQFTDDRPSSERTLCAATVNAAADKGRNRVGCHLPVSLGLRQAFALGEKGLG